MADDRNQMLALLMGEAMKDLQPAPERSPKQRIATAISDVMLSIGQGLANRGRGGQTTGLGAALSAGPLLAQQRQQQAEAKRTQALQMAMQVAGLQSSQRGRQITEQGLARDIHLERIGQRQQGATSGMDPAFFETLPPAIQEILGPPGGIIAPPVPREIDPGIPALGISPEPFRPAQDPSRWPSYPYAGPGDLISPTEAVRRAARRQERVEMGEDVTTETLARVAAQPHPNRGKVQQIADDLFMFNEETEDFDVLLGSAIETGRGSWHDFVRDGKVVFFNPETQETVETGYPAEGLNVTDAQRRAGGFLVKATSAHAIAQPLEEAFLNGTLSYFETSTLDTTSSIVNAMRGEEAQLLSQAMREFTEAYLRPVSGAAIPESEYEMTRHTYFPVIGNNRAIIEQKRQARVRVLQALRIVTANAVSAESITTPQIAQAYLDLANGNQDRAIERMRKDGLVD